MANHNQIKDEYINFVEDHTDDLEELQDVEKMMYQTGYNNSFKEIFYKI